VLVLVVVRVEFGVVVRTTVVVVSASAVEVEDKLVELVELVELLDVAVAVIGMSEQH
jgi:hypothetical protein